MHMFQKNKKNFFIVSVTLLLLWNLYEERTIEIKVPCHEEDFIVTMPFKDKKRIEALFYELFFRETGAYTLFENKPMFMRGYVKPFALTGWQDFSMSKILVCQCCHVI